MTEKYFYAVGRRKTSSATVHLKKGKGNILVKKDDEYVKIENFFSWEWSKNILQDALYPFLVLGNNVKKMFDITIHVKWGGLRGQAEAIRLGLSRALVEFNPEYRLVIKPYGLLKRDPREKERKKPGLRKARKSPQWSKR